MSYQIKSTPYFRRMFNNSKKNGQLQRLREEYERIQEFNDRTIELKMRQVRLKRLFREIEEMKESGGGGGGSSSVAANAVNRARGGGVSPSPTSFSHRAHRRSHQAQGHQRHRHHHPYNLLTTGITPEQRRHHQRAEALIRSRELGKALSRRNAQMTEVGGMSGFLSQLRNSSKVRAVADFRRDAQERRERAAKRISYGNDQSRQNLQRHLRVCQRRLTAKCQPQHSRDSGSNQGHPDYEHVTPSQLDMMVDEEDLASEHQRYFREQEEDELQLTEDRYRRQEKRLRREAGSSISSEEEDGQEELRFLRGEQTLSDDENMMKRLRRNKHQRHTKDPFLGDHKYNLTLAEEHFRLQAAYSDEEPQVDLDEDDEVTHKRGHKREPEKPRRRRLCEKSSLLTSTAIGTAQSSLSHHHHYQPYQPVSAALSSDQEMLTAPLATEELMTPLVIPRSVKSQTASETDDVPALNNWRRVSLMMSWFKVFTPPKSQSECSRNGVGGTMQELREMGQTAEPYEQSLI
ncbi:hypothetical protein KR038_004087 [Drosophila bunnanda]|nr:hypothetical protein KR038_004087 [Drosophila bunnanda]